MNQHPDIPLILPRYGEVVQTKKDIHFTTRSRRKHGKHSRMIRWLVANPDALVALTVDTFELHGGGVADLVKEAQQLAKKPS